MVVKDDFEGEQVYRCGICGFHYRDREMAQRCEEFCKGGSCSSEITQESLERSS